MTPAEPALPAAGRAERLIEAGRSLLVELDVEVVLERLLETARELTGARYAAIGVLDNERSGLERFLTSGVDAATRAAIGELPRGRGILGLLIDEPRPLVLADVGSHPRSYGFPDGHPPMATFLGVPLLIRGEAWGNLYLTEKRSGEFDDADLHAVGVLADWAAIAIEHARVYRESVAHADELERAMEGLQATTAIARALGSETDLGRVLELIVKRGRALVRARTIVLLLQEGDLLVAVAGAGQLEAQTLGASLPAGGSVAGEVLRSGRPERIADVSVRLGLHDEQLGIAGAETALLVPLHYRERALGVLCAFDRLDEVPEFGDRDEELLLSFAASAATAVATARSVEAARLRHSLRSAERERSRWARELHDETLQGLGALGVLLAAGLRGWRSARAVRAAGDRAAHDRDREPACAVYGATTRGARPARPRGGDRGTRPPLGGRRRPGGGVGCAPRRRCPGPGAQDGDLPARAGGADERGQARARGARRRRGRAGAGRGARPGE